MKKVTLIVVSLLAMLFSYSQNFTRVVRASKSVFKNQKWTVVETQMPTDMFIIMKDWDITIGTYKLKTYGEPEKSVFDDHVTYTWKCINSEAEKCYFMMKKFRSDITNNIIYAVLYEQYALMFEYECQD